MTFAFIIRTVSPSVRPSHAVSFRLPYFVRTVCHYQSSVSKAKGGGIPTPPPMPGLRYKSQGVYAFSSLRARSYFISAQSLLRLVGCSRSYPCRTSRDGGLFSAVRQYLITRDSQFYRYVLQWSTRGKYRRIKII